MRAKVIGRTALTPTVQLLELSAPEVAAKARPGQFVMVMAERTGERIPLSLTDWDRERGTISLVVSEVGQTTRRLAQIPEGSFVPHLAGPLGRAAEIGLYGNVACVAIGYGMATMMPIARALRETGNQVFSIVSAPSTADFLCMGKLAAVSDRLIATTADGSYGTAGWVTQPLAQLLKETTLQRVYAIGSLCMMKLVAEATRAQCIRTIVSLNPIMVDGTGMCGACRCSVGDKTRFACVDGPEFDGHQVDWDLLMARRCTYPQGPQQGQSYRCDSCGQW
jgi:ferredoxin/flavodoxin---NADP+ reductase